LSDVKDADFFSAELDAALINGEVDFCVHSMKDLSDRRPAAICRAAIPVRENPRDVIVFRAGVIDRLKQGQPIRIGSSSRRRQANVGAFLLDALPHATRQPALQFETLRGAVDERLRRIQISPDRPDALDGVVLALAGLARLWRDTDGRRSIRPMLENVCWMVLPLSACPAAPGQGALAIECRRDDARTRSLLQSLHDPATASLVQREMDVLANVREELQSGVGVTARDQRVLGQMIYVRGPDHATQRLIWNHPPSPDQARPWDAGRIGARLRSLVTNPELGDHAALFVAHWHAVTDEMLVNTDSRIWTSGVRSWHELARLGLWVEGCADNLGFTDVLATIGCPVLRLPALSEWTVITHSGATASWRQTGVGQVIATYSIESSAGTDGIANLEQQVRAATHFFWGSAGQYAAVKQWIPAGAHHACGVGKTMQALTNIGIDTIQPFPSREAWQTWLR
jgi:hydroxymethylbilane synthase